MKGFAEEEGGDVEEVTANSSAAEGEDEEAGQARSGGNLAGTGVVELADLRESRANPCSAPE